MTDQLELLKTVIEKSKAALDACDDAYEAACEATFDEVMKAIIYDIENNFPASDSFDITCAVRDANAYTC